MTLTEAKKAYKGMVPMECWGDYRNPDRFVYINKDDPDLQKFRIRLPNAINWGLMDNFGLPAYDQLFQYESFPERLMALERSVRRTRLRNRTRKESRYQFERLVTDNIWGVLENNPKEYRYEIDWIKKMWHKRKYGHWFFNHGKATYLDPWHWWYLNFWTLENVMENDGKPAYRDRDRKWFHAQRYAYVTTEAPCRNGDGSLSTLSDNTPKMKNMGARTVFGTNNLKGRRVGDTSKALSILLNEASRNYEYYNGIQGNKETTAEGIFREKLMLAFRKMPFFFIPEMPNLNHSSELVFSSPEFRGGLNSKIDFATTAKRHYYDSKKLKFLFVDEIGKTEAESVDRRHEVLKRCISPGVEIQGFMMCASTVDNMDMDSAKEFEKLSRASHFEQRLENGQTGSGLINIYIPHYESVEGFIDRYGMPIMYEPTKEQIPYMGRIVRNKKGRIMGSMEYLQSIEDEYRKNGDLMRLTEFQRMNPKSWRECWANVGRNFFFNTDILRARAGFLSSQKEQRLVRGDFVWRERFGGNVEFVPNELDGKFIKSMDIEPKTRSRSIFDGYHKRPAFKDVFIASADPFRLEKTEGYRMSNGSGAVLYMHDPCVDGADKEVRDYVTNRFVCTYVNRPPTRDEFCEDMLKMCVYWGALMYPENNIDIVNDYFIRKGYNGYLLYNIDPVTGRKKNNAGFTTAGPTIKKKLFNLASDWINLHGHRCDHPEILNEMLDIEGPDSMTDHDLFVAVVGCLLGQEGRYVDFMKTLSSQKLDVKQWWGP